MAQWRPQQDGAGHSMATARDTARTKMAGGHSRCLRKLDSHFYELAGPLCEYHSKKALPPKRPYHFTYIRPVILGNSKIDAWGQG